MEIGSGTILQPHKASNLPGYRGYCPQLKYECGHTYGYATDMLTRKYTKNEKLRLLTNTEPKETHLPAIITDGEKYGVNMVPGYTGFVPHHSFKYGETYAVGTEDAICDSKNKYHAHSIKQDELRRITRSQLPSRKRPDTSPPDNSHPGLNLRYLTTFGKNKLGDKRSFTEPAIPGYQGYVPRKEEHMLGMKYSLWTRHAYEDAMRNLEATENMKNSQNKFDANTVNLKNEHTSPWVAADQRLGSIYNKRLGMIPNYTGFIPQRRFDCGNTYGDATRSLPICYDPLGYSRGTYKDSSEALTPTVIPVRI